MISEMSTKLPEGLSIEEYNRINCLLGRLPNKTELGIFYVMWSEHCSYKSSRALLRLLPTYAPWVLQGPGENAGIIDIGGGKALILKVESHNHPSAIEPYQGAATGVGGIIRDIFTMGGRPIALLNSLRFGPLNNPQSKRLLTGVVSGIAGYGNCIGIPTIGGECLFDENYQENPLVNVMCVGIVDCDKIIPGHASGEFNPIIYVGSDTGRDGLGGAAFASGEINNQSYLDRPRVQVGDPFREKLLLEACLELAQSNMVIGMQDMGAAGLTCASAEMASRGGVGIELDIRLVPRREEGMTPYEIMLSESQERMLICVKKGCETQVKEIFSKWDLHAVIIGKVTTDKMLRIKDGETLVAELPVEAITHGPEYLRPEEEPVYIKKVQAFDLTSILTESNPADVLLKLLASPDIANKRWIYEQYDYMVMTNTIIHPGKADAAVLRIKDNKNICVAMTIDGNGRYCYLDSYWGGAIAVAEAARNLVSVGAKPMALTDCLNFGNPEKPEVMWQFRRTIEGISEACKQLGIPIISGNVSFYNEAGPKHIYPTPIIGMVGIIESPHPKVKSMGFVDEGDLICLLGRTYHELGGSTYLKVIHQQVAGVLPQLNLGLEGSVHDTCLQTIEKGIVKSAHDCGDGGLGVALAESAITGERGASIYLSDRYSPEELFSESQSRIIITISADNLLELKGIAEANATPYSVIGEVMGENIVINDWMNISVSRLKELWEEGL